MLTARKTSMGRRWEIAQDGRPLGRLAGVSLRSAARLEIAERTFDIAPTRMGRRWTVREGDRVVVEVDRPGRARWSVTHEGHTWTGRRTSFWRGEQALYDGETLVGHIRRLRVLRPEAEADLPGLPEPVGAIVLAVVVLVAQRNASQGAAAGAAASG